MMADKLPAGRLLAVGDIHGCLPQLQRLLGQVAPLPRDRLVFLGDYVDRGEDSRGVIEFLLALRRRLPETVFLRGNHEQMLLAAAQGRNTLQFLINGGTATLDSYGVREAADLPPEHLAFLNSLPTRYACGNFLFVHAGVRPGIPLEAQSDEDLLWIRQDFLAADPDWEAVIVFGHTPQQEPLLEPRRLGLDTGAVYGRQLTCCEVRTRRCWQAD